MPSYVSNECPKCGGGLPPENNKYQKCPYCGQGLVLSRSSAEISEDVAHLKSQDRHEEFDVRRENYALQRGVQDNLNERTGLNSELRKFEAVMDAQTRLGKADLDNRSRVAVANMYRDGMIGAARGRGIEAKKQEFTNQFKMFMVVKIWGVLGLLSFVAVVYFGGRYVWDNYLSKIDLSHPPSNSTPANTVARKPEEKHQATVIDEIKTPNEIVTPNPAPAVEGGTREVTARVSAMSGEISGNRYITVTLRGILTWHGEDFRFYLSGQNITVGDALTYPITNEMAKRKQTNPAHMNLDLYNLEGFVQSTRKRPELEALSFDTGIRVNVISNDGSFVVLDVDGRACEVPFVEGSDTPTKLSK